MLLRNVLGSPLVGDYYSTFVDLPSPSVSPEPPDEVTSAKTHAFFGSPFGSLTPPKPHRLEEEIRPVELTDQSFVETDPDPDAQIEGGLIEGGVISSSSASLKLIRALGEGSFSSVWLARDLSSTALFLKTRRSLRDLRRKATSSEDGSVNRTASTSSRFLRRLRGGVEGTRPTNEATTTVDGPPSRASSISIKSGTVSSKKRLVAVKLTLRGAVEGSKEDERERTRTRVSFVREVEILKHISHPNIPPLLSHLTTTTHHILVLPFYPGGDLLSLVNDDETYDALVESAPDGGEAILKRIFTEICIAVDWMHSVGLVHRDIKLENILLTTPLQTILPIQAPLSGLPPSPTSSEFSSISSATFPSSSTSSTMASTSSSLTLPTPLIKLTDFGLSRFIDPNRPLLTTRCGSEAYAAPELVMGGGRGALTPTPQQDENGGGGYDARETDSWATGIVFYALLCRGLPFGEGPGATPHHHHHPTPGVRKPASGVPTASERKQWLMQIAKAEWGWPVPQTPTPSLTPTITPLTPASFPLTPDSQTQMGGRILLDVVSPSIRTIIRKLLTRDPSRRARVGDVLSESWFRSPFSSRSPSPSPSPSLSDEEGEPEEMFSASTSENGYFTPEDGDGEDRDDTDSEESDTELPDDGWLVDEGGIPRVAKEEVVVR